MLCETWIVFNSANFIFIFPNKLVFDTMKATFLPNWRWNTTQGFDCLMMGSRTTWYESSSQLVEHLISRWLWRYARWLVWNSMRISLKFSQQLNVQTCHIRRRKNWGREKRKRAHCRKIDEEILNEWPTLLDIGLEVSDVNYITTI